MRDIELMSDQAERTLSESVKAFSTRNADLALGVRSMAGQMGSTYHRALADLAREGEAGSRPLTDIFAVAQILKSLERVNDQAKNICEETMFAVTGETKPPKVYRILFVDETNTCLSKLAQAVAERDFPQSGRYDSAGWAPTGVLDPRCRELMSQHGLRDVGSEPVKLVPIHDELASYHVIVSLQGDARAHIPNLPFETVLLDWDVGPPMENVAPEDCETALQAAYEGIVIHVRQLLVTLHGQGAR
jgi:protein-tyrosine-phosphatase